MSASLVGSEMCIRDRSKPHQRAEGPSRKPGDRQLPEIPTLSTWPWLRRCLLYTSDAADDM
eukprot:4424561-Alexandrium_andersonii.AAC.1